MTQPSQALPALASFVIPGLGQLIQGRLPEAILSFFGAAVAFFSIASGIGLVLFPVIWIAIVLDAANYSPD